MAFSGYFIANHEVEIRHSDPQEQPPRYRAGYARIVYYGVPGGLLMD
jgi:hypothetical protein